MCSKCFLLYLKSDCVEWESQLETHWIPNFLIYWPTSTLLDWVFLYPSFNQCQPGHHGRDLKICLYSLFSPEHIDYALFHLYRIKQHCGFLGGTSGKESACQCRSQKRCRFNPWVEKIPWRRAWRPTLVFFPGEAQGQRSLAGCIQSVEPQTARDDWSNLACLQDQITSSGQWSVSKNSVSFGQNVLLLKHESPEATEAYISDGTGSIYEAFPSCISESLSIAKAPLTQDARVMRPRNKSLLG